MIDFALPLPRNLRKSATEGSFSAPSMTAATISIGGYPEGISSEPPIFAPPARTTTRFTNPASISPDTR